MWVLQAPSRLTDDIKQFDPFSGMSAVNTPYKENINASNQLFR